MRPVRAVGGRRFLAFVVDTVVTVFLTSVLLSALPSQYTRLRTDGLGESRDVCEQLLDGGASHCIPLSEGVVVATETPWRTWLTPVAVTLLIGVVLQGLTSMTPGKLLVGLRTVRADGRPPGVARALVRGLFWPVDAFPWCFPLVAVIALSGSRGHRRVGDKAAGTLVVRRSELRR